MVSRTPLLPAVSPQSLSTKEWDQHWETREGGGRGKDSSTAVVQGRSPRLMAVPPPGYEPLAPLPPAASAVPVWQDRTIASAKLRLLEYSAFMEVPRDAETVTVPSCPHCPGGPMLVLVFGGILLSSDLSF